jgi:hypothetical protein
MKDINSVYDPSIDEDIPMRAPNKYPRGYTSRIDLCKPYDGKSKSLASTTLRRQRASDYVGILIKCNVDLSVALKSEQLADIARRYYVTGESAKSIAESYSRSDEWVYNLAFGRKGSVYSMLRRYIKRIIAE